MLSVPVFALTGSFQDPENPWKLRSEDTQSNLIPGREWKITWKSVKKVPVILQVTIDGGVSWQDISNPLPAQVEQYRWKAEEDYPHQITFRLIHASEILAQTHIIYMF